jgi:HAD superfamily hydrolase (TIGR01509 family)
MRFDLVIFDCDGVLVDSEPTAARIFAEHLRAVGLAMTDEEVDRRFRGRSMASCLREVEELLAKPLPKTFLEDLQRDTFAAFREELQPVDGVAAVLDALRIPFCVASSGEHEKMRLTLGLTGLWPRFEGRIFSASEVTHGKPAPDLFLHAAERMGAKPGRCAVIEDSLPGVQAAVAAGMKVFGHAARPESDVKLAEAGAATFGSMDELLALLGEPPHAEKPGA